MIGPMSAPGPCAAAVAPGCRPVATVADAPGNTTGEGPELAPSDPGEADGPALSPRTSDGVPAGVPDGAEAVGDRDGGAVAAPLALGVARGDGDGAAVGDGGAPSGKTALVDTGAVIWSEQVAPCPAHAPAQPENQ